MDFGDSGHLPSFLSTLQVDLKKYLLSTAILTGSVRTENNYRTFGLRFEVFVDLFYVELRVWC